MYIGSKIASIGITINATTKLRISFLPLKRNFANAYPHIELINKSNTKISKIYVIVFSNTFIKSTRLKTSIKLSKLASSGTKVCIEFMLANIFASGFNDAEIIQIKGETKIIPIIVLPA